MPFIGVEAIPTGQTITFSKLKENLLQKVHGYVCIKILKLVLPRVNIRSIINSWYYYNNYILCADFNVIHARANKVINMSYVIILKKLFLLT